MKNNENKNIVDNEYFDDILDGKTEHLDFRSLKDGGISWLTRLLLKVSPLRGIMRLSRELGADSTVAEKVHGLFGGIKRIDIVPSASGSRGFQLILDKSTALYFYQDGDHFLYDGFEVGEYEGGDVTVFD